MGTWTNADGLYIKYGQDESTVGNGGEYMVLGPLHVVEVTLDLTDLATDAQTILSDNTVIPLGAFIEKVEVTVTEASAGTNSNLDLGIIKMDRTTEGDYNGLTVAADGWHTSAVGTVTEYTQGSEDHGALVGTVMTYAGLLCANAETAVFTDGTLKIRVFYSM